MKSDLFQVRRRFAKAAFVSILLTLFSCLLIVVFGSAETAKNLNEAGIIIAPIIACLTGVIGQYSHLVFKQDNEITKSI